MADNTTLNAGAGGDVVASDDIAGVKFQRVKLTLGADGANDLDVATGNPMPVTGTVTAAQATAANLNAEVQGDAAHDAVVSGNPVLAGAYASAVTPADVTADGDAVRVWATRNGAQATVLTAAGALIGGDAGNGLDVDVTRLPALVASSANIGDVDVLTVPAPLSTTGGGVEATALRVTLASDSTGLVSVDDNGASLTVDGTVTAVGGAAHDAAVSGNPVLIGGYASAAAPTAVDADGDAVRAWLLRNGATTVTITAAGALIPGDATNGLDVDVTRLPALVASSANIGDVDVLTVPAPLSTTGAGTEAAALRVTIANDSTGLLSVDDNGSSLTVDGTVTAAGGAAHDAAVAGNPNLIAGYASAAAPTSVDADGDAVRAWMLRNGATATVLTAAGALVGGDAANGLDVDVTRLPALVAGSANIGDVDVLTVPAPLSTTGGGTEATALRVTLASDSTGLVSVDDNSGTLTVDAPVGTPVNVQIGNATLTAGVIDETGASAVDALAVGGGTAHDAVDSGNPLKMGVKALSALPTAVATADRANAIGDLFGRMLVGHIDPGMQTHKNLTYTTQQTGTDVWDPAAGKKIAVTSVVLGSYGTTAGRIILWFGDNADTTFTQDTDQVLVAASFAPSATAKPGLVVSFATPVFCTTADRELHITTDAALSVDVTIEGYEW